MSRDQLILAQAFKFSFLVYPDKQLGQKQNVEVKFCLENYFANFSKNLYFNLACRVCIT